MQVIIKNLVVHYSREGKGSKILLLHGWGQSNDTFSALRHQLSETYDVVALDLPGFGKTQRPDTAWDIYEYAKFVGDFMKKIDIDPVCIIGHSFGGRVIIKGVSQSIFAPEKIVLIGSAGIRPKVSAKQKALQSLSAMSKKVPYTNSIRNVLRQKLGSEDYLKSGEMQQIFLKTINEDLRDDARNITIPTLLLWGADDDQTPLSDGEELNELIRGSVMKSYENAGHFVYLERPKEILDSISEFVK